jgi:two-component sensor histidine kinase/PAS domain-containing protein
VDSPDRRSRRFDSVVFRLLLLAAIPLITVGIAGLIVYRHQVAPLRSADALSELKATNGTATALIDSWIEGRSDFVRYMVGRPEAVAWDTATMLAEARRLTAAFPEVHAVVFADRSGRVVVDSIRGTGGSVGDREYFRDALTGRSVVTHLILAQMSGRPSLVVAGPVREADGRVIGVGFAVVRPEAIELALNRVVEDVNVTTFVLDSNGVLATGEEAGRRVDPHHLPPRTESDAYTNRHGTRVYGTRTTIDRTGWTVVSEVEEASITATFVAYNRILAGWVIAAMAVATGLAIALAATIQIPVRRLGSLATIIRSSGHTGTDPFPTMKGAPIELRDLRDNLVSMAEVIEARQRDLARSNELLAATQDVAHVGSWEYTPGSGEFACSDELLRIVGMPEGRGAMTLREAGNLLHPDDRSATIRRVWQSLVSRESGFEIEHRLQIAGSSENRYVLHRASHARDEAGRWVSSRGTMYDITERHRAEESLRVALEEKSILLQEVHHRVRNNLAIVESILALQRDQLPTDSRAYRSLTDAHSRVLAMGLLHRHLYETGSLAEIHVNDYVTALIAMLRESYGQPGIEVTSTLDDAVLTVGAAMPCGLILNELIVNAYKHAFPSGVGTIEVRVRMLESDEMEVAVVDNGIGADQAEVADGEKSGGLGTELTERLAEQLGGGMAYSHNGGTAAVLRFPTGSRTGEKQ